MLPSDSLSQTVMLAVIWIVVCVIVYNALKNVIVTAGLAVVSAHYNDFELGILKYDAIVYYLSVIFIFVFLTIQVIKKKRFG